MSFTGRKTAYQKDDPLFTVIFKLRSFKNKATVVIPVEVYEPEKPEPATPIIDETDD